RGGTTAVFYGRRSGWSDLQLLRQPDWWLDHVFVALPACALVDANRSPTVVHSPEFLEFEEPLRPFETRTHSNRKERCMIRLKDVHRKYQEAGPFHSVIAVQSVIHPNVMLTKRGDLLTIVRVHGREFECAMPD